MSYLLAADVGGTKVFVALAEVRPQGQAVVAQQLYLARDYTALEPMLAEFLARPDVAPHAQAISAGCLSVAGPVVGNGTTLTNLGWRIDGSVLAGRFGIPTVLLINDFAAAAIGLARLSPEDLAPLQAGSPREHGVKLIVGAGTGLGVGWLTWEGGRYVAHDSEGGHGDFAPVDEMQDRLLAHLRRIFGRVSCERVVSGPGLMRIFSFLQETGAGIPSRPLVEASKKRADTTEVIGEFGVARSDPLAMCALDLFVAAYGAFAGDMALATLARGGVYIAGGIAPKILPRMQEGAFMRAFVNKGRYREVLQTIPVNVVLNPQVGLYGALLEAGHLAV